MFHRRLLLFFAALAVVMITLRPVGSAGQSTCAVTEPPTPPFTPPLPVVAVPPQPGWFWYGTNALWTRLRDDGKAVSHDESFWWHPGFDGRHEPRPKLQIMATELQTRTRVLTPRATNAFADDLGGWAMLTMLNFPVPGCWFVTATYQGTSVSYVVEAA